MRLGHASDAPNHVIQRNYKPSSHNPKNCKAIQKSDEKSSTSLRPFPYVIERNVAAGSQD